VSAYVFRELAFYLRLSFNFPQAIGFFAFSRSLFFLFGAQYYAFGELAAF
jgi:hypothetical protein